MLLHWDGGKFLRPFLPATEYGSGRSSEDAWVKLLNNRVLTLTEYRVRFYFRLLQVRIRDLTLQ